ncbi:MAG: hypothetical protein QXY62_00515 [Candidatus Altiarchaeota archaeon]
MAKDVLNHPVILKAKELADALAQSEAFKKKNINKLQSIIVECNQIIVETTKINYGAICQPRSGCCG